MNAICLGGGRDSTAMLYGMWKRGIPIDLILFSDTGAEQPRTYRFIRLLDGWLKSRGLPRVTRVRYHMADGTRLTLEEECLQGHHLPSIAYGRKGCSIKHKLLPQDKRLNSDKRARAEWAAGRKVHKYIGYDAGEKMRVAHAVMPPGEAAKYEKHYPLVEWGWDREKCGEVLRAAGLPIPGKSSCFFCPSMKKAEIRALWEGEPELFERAVAMEHGARETLTSIKGLGRDWSWEDYRDAYTKGLPIRDYDRGQYAIDGFAEPGDGCLCGAPCGCYDG